MNTSLPVKPHRKEEIWGKREKITISLWGALEKGRRTKPLAVRGRGKEEAEKTLVYPGKRTGGRVVVSVSGSHWVRSLGNTTINDIDEVL